MSRARLTSSERYSNASSSKVLLPLVMLDIHASLSLNFRLITNNNVSSTLTARQTCRLRTGAERGTHFISRVSPEMSHLGMLGMIYHNAG